MTKQEIEAAKTVNGGYTKAQLAQWGIPWPPPKGWKQKLIKPVKTKHPSRIEGYQLEFANGHIWSCVNLASKFRSEVINDPYVDPHLNAALESIGKMYDKMGGRYEAMPIAPAQFMWSQQLRAHDMQTLIELVNQYENKA